MNPMLGFPLGRLQLHVLLLFMIFLCLDDISLEVGLDLLDLIHFWVAQSHEVVNSIENAKTYGHIFGLHADNKDNLLFFSQLSNCISFCIGDLRLYRCFVCSIKFLLFCRVFP